MKREPYYNSHQAVDPRNLTRRSPHVESILNKRHRCTDVLCCFIFFIFILTQICLSIFAFLFGNPLTLISPKDSNGNLCRGSTPNLIYFNLAACLSAYTPITGCPTPTVCVQSCPRQNLFYVIDSYRQILYNNYCNKNALNTYYSPTHPPPTVNITGYEDLIKANICPIYTLQSSAVFQRCLPSIINEVVNKTITVFEPTTNTTSFTIQDLDGQNITTDAIEQGIKQLNILSRLNTIAQLIFYDFINSSVLIAILVSIAAVASFIYILLTRWIVAPIIALITALIIATHALAIYFSINEYIMLKNNDTDSSIFVLTSNLDYYTSLPTTWLIVTIVACVCLLVVLLLLIVLFKRVILAIALIKEGSKAVSGVVLSLFFPVIPFILQIGFLAYFVATGVYLASTGVLLFRLTNSTYNSTNYTEVINFTNSTSYQIGDPCDPSTTSQHVYAQFGLMCVFYTYGAPNSISTSGYFGTSYSLLNSIGVINFLNNYQWVPQVFNWFMFFWCEAFVIGFNQLTLAGCFGIWFWSKSRSQCILFHSIIDSLIYHMGTIAFGSILIALCKTIQSIIAFVENRVKSATEHNARINCCVNFVMCCCKCCFWCLEKIIKFVNRNAYIMTAIYGTNFCKSARDAIALLAANPMRAIVLDRVTDFVLFLGRLLITVGVGVLGFYFFTGRFYIAPQYRQYLQPQLHYYWIPLACIIICTYFITKTFFTVFEMAIDTVFLCALKDLEIHDGSPQKPYYMSTSLRRILNVANVHPESNLSLKIIPSKKAKSRSNVAPEELSASKV